MKKRTPSKLTVKRISTSPYFKESFAKLEKDSIEQKAEALVLPLNSSAPTDVLITNTHTIVENISLSDYSHCKLMIHPNSGYDNLHTDFVRDAPFPIVIGNPIRAHAVANYILSALFSHYSPVREERAWSKTRKWERRLLSELNVLILGEGHIGSLLKKSLSPLVANLAVYDPYQKNSTLRLENIDVLVPACSLNAKNHHMIDRDLLMALKDNFLLINAARGNLVKTTDLIDVLKMRPDAFAVLDVFEKEPADFSQFSDLKNIRLSSHIAGVYADIDNVTASFVAKVIFDFQNLEDFDFKEKYKNVFLKNRLVNGDFLI
ncbi:MAG: NAD(P)-dependent oxidoreductase [Bacteriovorax sp.]